MKLTDMPCGWAKHIIERSQTKRENHLNEIQAAGYDIVTAAKELENFYLNKIWRIIAMAFLTVFTPAYNRAHTLPRTYESLCQQDCKDFIWLIVDDGSTDETADLVKGWQKKKTDLKFNIFIKKMEECILRITKLTRIFIQN